MRTTQLPNSERKWIKIAVEEIADSVKISISDSGPGVAADIRESIMVPFFTTKEVGRGMGLGLSIARSIVEDHRGTLTLDERKPETTFIVSLPKQIW